MKCALTLKIALKIAKSKFINKFIMKNSNKGDNFRSGQGQNNKQKITSFNIPSKFPNQNKTHKRKGKDFYYECVPLVVLLSSTKIMTKYRRQRTFIT